MSCANTTTSTDRRRGVEPDRAGRGAARADPEPGSADKYGKTPAQVVLRWQVQVGNIVFPKSVNPNRIRENIDVFDFELADDDIAEIRR